MPAHSVSHSQNFHEAVGGSNANEAASQPASYPLTLSAAEIINIHTKEVEINQDYFQLYVL